MMDVHRTHLKYSSTVAMALGGADSNCLWSKPEHFGMASDDAFHSSTTHT